MKRNKRESFIRGREVLSFLPLLAGLLLWALLSGQDEGKASQLIKASQGGQVRSPSGRAVLAIPAGALAADTKITVAELPAMEGPGLGPVYDLQPDGLKLLKPATFTVKYSPQELAGEFEPDDVVLVAVTDTAKTQPAVQQGQAAQPLLGWDYLETGVDVSAGAASVQLMHLSKYSLRGCSSFRLGEKNKQLKGKFDWGLKFQQAQGSGSSFANYLVRSGELFAWAEAPRGTQGMAVAQSQMSKLFRVKPGKDGRRSTTTGRVAVKLVHKAELGPDTNQYLIALLVQCYSAKPIAAMGAPRVLDDLQSMTEGRLMMAGLFQQNFFEDPEIGGLMTAFPLGPRYHECEPLVVFENCRLEAGKYYGVTIAGTVGINGQERDDARGIPAKGGRVDWAKVLSYFFLISRVEVSSD